MLYDHLFITCHSLLDYGVVNRRTFLELFPISFLRFSRDVERTKILIFRNRLSTMSIVRAIVYWTLTIYAVSNYRIGGTSVPDSGKAVDPSPYSLNNKVVGFVIQPVPKMDRYDSLIMILDEYVSMCEGRKSSLAETIFRNSQSFLSQICLIQTYL